MNLGTRPAWHYAAAGGRAQPGRWPALPGGHHGGRLPLTRSPARAFATRPNQ